MQKFIAPLSIASTLLLTGCPVDNIESKVAILVDQLTTDGMAVSLSGNVGTATLPLDGSISSTPEDATIQLYVDSAVTITVTSVNTGTSANFTEGTYVEGTPANPGEYTWTLSANRDSVTCTFFNETVAGTTLKTDRTYTAELAVAENPYLETQPSVSVAVSVQ